ncbi:MAG: T9SS type A sorting domain-containing protein, partial [Bacteroidia bacterium]
PPVTLTERMGRNISLVTKSKKSGSTYTWQINRGTGYSVITNGGQFSGAGTDSLIISNLTMANAGNKIRCIVRNNSCADTTAETTLQVLNTQSSQNLSIITSVYPNPCHELLTLVSNQSSSFQVIDMNGKICKSGALFVGENQINVTDLPTGIYAIKPSSGPSLRFFKTTK